jgi:hypothetical protein
MSGLEQRRLTDREKLIWDELHATLARLDADLLPTMNVLIAMLGSGVYQSAGDDVRERERLIDLLVAALRSGAEFSQ